MSTFVNLLEIIYPVGSIYFSVDSTSPSEKIGGSWVQLDENRVLMPGNSFDIGGSSKIAKANLPTHRHYPLAVENGKNDHGGAWSFCTIVYKAGEAGTISLGGSGRTGFGTADTVGVDYTYVNTSSYTENGAEDGLVNKDYYPAYRTVFCWYRIA